MKLCEELVDKKKCGAYLVERHAENGGHWYKCKHGHWKWFPDVGAG